MTLLMPWLARTVVQSRLQGAAATLATCLPAASHDAADG